MSVFSAITLAFNFLYISQSTHVLIDGPMAVFCVLLILSMTKVNLRNFIKYDICAGLIGSSIILLKWSGVLVIPFFIGFYSIAFPEISFIERLKKAKIPLLMVSLTVALLLINNFMQLGRILPDVSALSGKYLVKPFWYYIINFDSIIMVPCLIPFFAYGLFIVSTDKKREGKLLVIWFFVFLAGISMAQEKDLRYSLLILPSSLVISGIGVEQALKKIFKRPGLVLIGKMICIVCLVLFYWQMYARTQKFLLQDSLQYIGFKEAGAWIKKEADSNTVVMAGSPRVMRYYSGINFKEFGGNIEPLPKKRADLEKVIRIVKGPIILEVDRWERTQPRWIYPFSENKIKYLETLGFKLQKTVFRKTENDNKDVVWVFKRE